MFEYTADAIDGPPPGSTPRPVVLVFPQSIAERAVGHQDEKTEVLHAPIAVSAPDDDLDLVDLSLRKPIGHTAVASCMAE